MISINCDIGERGADHPVDRELMKYLDIANLACGGHAGDVESVSAFRKLAEKNLCRVSAHLSYHDRKNFGRTSMALSAPELHKALDRQYALLSDVKLVKPHGALYNDCCVDAAKAGVLLDWLLKKRIEEIIVPTNSVIAEMCRDAGIHVLGEAFAERHYNYDPASGRLTLASRTKPYASIKKLDMALAQCQKILDGAIDAYIDDFTTQPVPIATETICIHSDSDIALELVIGLRRLLDTPFRITGQGMFEYVGPPLYGRQDIGIAPGGALDRFAYLSGCRLTGSAHAMEILFPPKFEFTRRSRCVLTGAHRENMLLTSLSGSVVPICHNTAFTASPGETLSMGKATLGYRTYLCWNADENFDSNLQALPVFRDICSWSDPDNCIRVTRGPEFDRLRDSEAFFMTHWRTTKEMSRMGIRLENSNVKLEVESEKMISGPVADGTIQLTPDGPIILMRQRQTIGGYPRIFNVVEVDIDRLAQYPPNCDITFKLITENEARELLKKQHIALVGLK